MTASQCHSDHRPYLAVVIDLDRVSSPVQYEDERRIYPHIHGPLPAEAVLGVAGWRGRLTARSLSSLTTRSRRATPWCDDAHYPSEARGLK